VHVALREGDGDTGLPERSIDCRAQLRHDRQPLVDRFEEAACRQLQRVLAEVLENAERRRFSQGSRMRPHHVTEELQRPLHVAAVGDADAYDDARLGIGQRPVEEPTGDVLLNQVRPTLWISRT